MPGSGHHRRGVAAAAGAGEPADRRDGGPTRGCCSSPPAAAGSRSARAPTRRTRADDRVVPSPASSTAGRRPAPAALRAGARRWVGARRRRCSALLDLVLPGGLRRLRRADGSSWCPACAATLRRPGPAGRRPTRARRGSRRPGRSRPTTARSAPRWSRTRSTGCSALAAHRSAAALAGSVAAAVADGRGGLLRPRVRAGAGAVARAPRCGPAGDDPTLAAGPARGRAAAPGRPPAAVVPALRLARSVRRPGRARCAGAGRQPGRRGPGAATGSWPPSPAVRWCWSTTWSRPGRRWPSRPGRCGRPAAPWSAAAVVAATATSWDSVCRLRSDRD